MNSTIQKSHYHSLHWAEILKDLVGELARPIAIIVTSVSAAVATTVIARKVDSFEGAALFIGAVFSGVALLYGAKAWENAKSGRHQADVEIAKATTVDPASLST